MTDQQRATELFLACCELHGAERADFLAESCRGDPGLLAAVEGMLAFDEKRPEFLAGKAADELRPGGEELPHSIGPFRIRRKLGEGGMGIVYEAEQERPRRTVALKILRPLFVSSDALRRFQHEGDFLGRLQHPGIAQIFDSGCVETGHGPLPYFAMELVRGRPLTEYASQQGLPVRERLELVAAVADAVQHAHQQGVIHRDLKPQNILVDASGQPKILDFGIARATDSDVQLTTQHTDVGQILGTLAYMSPEQAAGEPLAIDTRSDVYSLGVLLFELLAERLPYDVSQKSLPEAVRVIQGNEPSRLGTIKKTYRGDMDTIVRMALEKDKERRYASAAAMATDIRRFLRNEPITARPPSRTYTLRKFARRNRTVVGATAAVFVTLLAGLATSVRFGIAEAAQRRIVERAAYRDRLSLTRRAMDEGDASEARQELDAAPVALRNWEWRHLDQRLEPLLAQTVVPGVVDAVYLDEVRILAIDASCAAHVWNTMTGETTLVSARPTTLEPERPLALTADGGLLLSYADGVLILRDPLGDETAGATLLPFPGAEPLRVWGTCAIAADGSRVAVATESGELRLVESSGESRTLLAEELPGGVRAVSIGLNGSWFAVELGLGLRSWEYPSMEVRYSGDTHQMGPAAFAPDGSALAMAYSNTKADVWIRKTGADASQVLRRRQLGDHQFRPFSKLRYSATGLLLAATFDDGETWILDTTRDGGRLVNSVPCAEGQGTRVQISPNGGSLLSFGLGNDGLKLWSTGLDLGAQVLVGHTATLHAVAFSPDGATLASTAWDGSVRLWDGMTGASVVTLRASLLVRPLAFSADGGQLSWSSSNRGPKRLVVWDTTLGKVVNEPWASDFGESNCHALAYSPDGSFFAVGGTDGRIHLKSPRNSADALVIEAQAKLESGLGDPGIRALAFDSKGILLGSGTFDGRLTLWDPRSGASLGHAERVAAGDAQHSGVNSIAFSPDGTRIAAGYGNSAVTIFEVPSLREVRVLQGHREEVFAVAYSPDGSRIASGGRDGLLRLWDADTGQPLIELGGHESYIMSLAFSPDGRRIATGSGDATLRLWGSEAAAVRRKARHTDELLRSAAEDLVTRLYQELGQAPAVAASLEADAELDPAMRRLGLQAILRREVAAERSEPLPSRPFER